MPKRLPKHEMECFRNGIASYISTGFHVTNVRNLIWLITENITVPPKCHECNNLVNWNITKKQYNAYCCRLCAHRSDDVKQKIKQSNALKMDQTIKNRQDTNLMKYGTTNYLSSDIGKNHIKQVLVEKYDVSSVSAIPSVQQTKRLNSINKWGESHPSKTKIVQQKIRDTCTNKYGVKSWAQQHISTSTLNNLNDVEWLYEQHVTKEKTLADISLMCDNVDPTTVGRYIKKAGIPIQHYTKYQSHYETEIADWLTGCGITNFQQNVRTIISPYELDIVLPEFCVAIEFCGVYWHGDWRLDKRYHLDKLERCEALGYQLITVFEDEWNHRANQVKNAILSKMGLLHGRKVGARNTKIVKINNVDKRDFFESYHIQGTGPGSITYGLFIGDEVVAMMTLIQKTNKELILNRYATSCIVQGGFSKLLNHVRQSFPLCSIITFADRRYSKGLTYHSHGFELVDVLPPSYCYVVNKRRVHRFQFRRHLLDKRLSVFDPQLTEFENCDRNGIVRLWDCGMFKFAIKPLVGNLVTLSV